MGLNDYYKPVIAMVGLQICFAGLALFSKAALSEGLSPRVFVAYRQGLATLVMAPLAFITTRRNSRNFSPVGLKCFGWMLAASLFGVTATQNCYFEGLYLASSTAASAMTNLIPAITFVMATICGMEKVNFRSLRSIAKLLGTVFCVSGAICMALIKGPKLLNTELLPSKAILDLAGGDTWLSFSLCKQFFLAVMDNFAGGEEAFSFLVQTWCISKRGPLFTAMFNPLCTVLVTIFAAIILQEVTYTGSLVGALAVILGLFVVLWGKAKDLEETEGQMMTQKLQKDQPEIVQILVDNSLAKKNCKGDLEEPLLSQKSN